MMTFMMISETANVMIAGRIKIARTLLDGLCLVCAGGALQYKKLIGQLNRTACPACCKSTNIVDV